MENLRQSGEDFGRIDETTLIAGVVDSTTVYCRLSEKYSNQSIG